MAQPTELPVLQSGGPEPSPAASRGEGLLHDARNLMGTIGLYCDLLSMPGVLKPEHRQYPEELRLLGARSKSLIDHLMQSLFVLEGEASRPLGSSGADGNRLAERESMQKGGPGRGSEGRRNTVKTPSLHSVVERCSGLLSRVANGRAIEIAYGPAAAVPVNAPDEAVERILVNLVRNAAAAMVGRTAASGRPARGAAENVRPAISIVVGSVASCVGEHRPWPFQRVRLVVEDTGCGMSPQQLERLLGGQGARSRGGHGVGFCVVRDLVAASGGEIRVMSEPEIGTRVQIEWPIAAMSAAEMEGTDPRELPGELSKQMEGMGS